jgi:hypothetical protein
MNNPDSAVSSSPSYRTSELELASFLRARGHRLLGVQQDGRFAVFEFSPEASSDADGYFRGTEVSARELFTAHRSLRALIQQAREHAAQVQTGSEIHRNDRASHPRR